MTIQNFLSLKAPEEVDTAAVGDYMSRMIDVVRDEDYATGFRVQQALATGVKEYSLFGRNEGGGQLFHRWVDAIVNTDDDDLPGLFERGLSA